MFTPIHRALGLEPGPLTWAMFEEAVERGVLETDDLDWKSTAYDSRAPNWRDEAAKDFAAMANSGGGWIVMGIDEVSATSAAKKITPVIWDAATEQRIRQVAYARVGPPLTGLEITVLYDDEGQDEGRIVVLRVRDSAEVPHFARKDENLLTAPRRTGSHTVFMSDREIEQSFRVRFQQAEDQERHLQALYERHTLAIDPSAGAALVLVAVPQEPVRNAPTMEIHTARNLIVQTSYGGLLHRTSGWSWRHGDVRRGLRGWVMRGTHLPNVYAKAVHEDGTVLAAHRLGNLDPEATESAFYPVGRPNDSMSITVEEALVDGMALVRNCAASLSVQGGYRIRVGLVGDPGDPLYLRTTENRSNYLLNISNAVPIDAFQPVTIDIDPLESVEAFLPVLQDVALDLINQGGVQHLQAIIGPGQT